MLELFRAPYSGECRRQIIELARAGKTAKQLAQEFGRRAKSMMNWLADGGYAGQPLAQSALPAGGLRHPCQAPCAGLFYRDA